MQNFVVQLPPVRTRRADGVDVRAGRQPFALQDRRGRGGRDHDHVRAAHGFLGRNCGCDSEFFREFVRLTWTPDPDFTKLSDDLERLEMTPRLHAGAEDGEHRNILAREQIGRDCGDCRGPHFGDQPAVHRHKGLAGMRAKEDDHGVMGRQTAIVRIKRDELGAERAAIGGHDSEETAVLRHRQNLAQWLLHMTRGKIAQRASHGGNQFLHPQERADFFFVEIHIVRCPLQIDQFAKLFQVHISAGDDADDRSFSGFAAQGRGQRQGSGAFGNDTRFLRHHPHRPARFFKTND